jgi:tetratricopeptide (TPR) repeat protein
MSAGWVKATMVPLVLSACVASPGPVVAGTAAALPADLFARGTERSRVGDFVRAEQYVVAAMARGYAEGACVRELVHLCIASRRLRTALAYAEPYAARHPGDAPLELLLSAIHAALGEPEQARALLEGVLRSRPDHARARYFLGVLLRDSFGEPGAAAAELEAYLSAEPAGEHAAEVRRWLEEHATRHTPVPMTRSRAHGGPPRSPSFGAGIPPRAGGDAPR